MEEVGSWEVSDVVGLFHVFGNYHYADGQNNCAECNTTPKVAGGYGVDHVVSRVVNVSDVASIFFESMEA